MTFLVSSRAVDIELRVLSFDKIFISATTKQSLNASPSNPGTVGVMLENGQANLNFPF